MSRRIPSRRWIALVATAGCVSLDVANTESPDIEQVFSSPTGLEQAISSGYQSCHNAIMVNSALGQLLNLSLETGPALVPPPSINSRSGGFSSTVGSGLDFVRLSLGARLAADAVDALDRLVARGGTLGSQAQNTRARAFGFFAAGCHQAWLAMIYDSAGVVTPGLSANAIPQLRGAQEVMRSALSLLDSAIAIASNPTATLTGGFPTPTTWMNGPSLSRDDFVRLVRSLRARFRAGVARTPVEREAVNWPQVIADVDAGVTADFTVTVSPTATWGTGVNAVAPTMPYFYYGMADTSGAYDAWLALPPDQRSYFLVQTPDRRWPQGATRAQQQANSVNPTSIVSRPYVGNRTTADPPAVTPYGMTFYFFNRLAFIRNNANVGAFPVITRAEMDLLAAEGYLRAGNVAAAATRIDITRVGRGQLPALTGAITSVGQPVPGGGACVPRVPKPPAFSSTQCGDVWEALKWEKRMETALTGFSPWFFDSRGWGDLIENTAFEFPVPSDELAARRLADYALGGGFPSSAKKGTYGF